MDLRFPSDEMDIPMLRRDRQPVGMDLPLLQWGKGSRRDRNLGTWHFYADDYKFEALWNKPDKLFATECAGIIEPNFSTAHQSPAPLFVWNTYRKRWLARYWQEHGVKVWVDLNVVEACAHINLLGVPKGWESYATRGSADTLEQVDWDYYLAKERCGKPPVFVVYGGGSKVEEHCRKRGYTFFRDSTRERVDRIDEVRRALKSERPVDPRQVELFHG